MIYEKMHDRKFLQRISLCFVGAIEPLMLTYKNSKIALGFRVGAKYSYGIRYTM